MEDYLQIAVHIAAATVTRAYLLLEQEDQGSQHPDTMEIEKGLAYCSEGVTTIQNWCENISERIQELRAMLALSKKRKEGSSSQTLRTPPFALDLSGTSPEEDIMKGKTTHASAGGGSSSGREATSQRLYPNLKSYMLAPQTSFSISFSHFLVMLFLL